jgi:hypothetical protein
MMMIEYSYMPGMLRTSERSWTSMPYPEILTQDKLLRKWMLPLKLFIFVVIGSHTTYGSLVMLLKHIFD